MRRREFVAGLGAGAWSGIARAQQRPVRRITIFFGTSENGESRDRKEAFEQGLEALGWQIGKNVTLQYRWANAEVNRIDALADELVRQEPDLIVASNTPVIAALLRRTRTLPILFLMISDPVRSGFVQSISRPGGNVTGFTNVQVSLATKWLEMLKVSLPRIERVGFMFNPETSQRDYAQSVQSAAQTAGITSVMLAVSSVSAVDPIVGALSEAPSGGLIVIPDAFTTSHGDVIVKATEKHHVPSVFAYRSFVASGALMSYGVDTSELHRRAAYYADRILRGVKPAELPVQAPEAFKLVINLRTAKALGLTIPETLLATADEVIQ